MQTQRFYLFLFLIALIFQWNANAQSSILEAYIEEGFQNNLALQNENLNIEKSIAALREARALYYPQVSFNATYTLAAGGRNIELPLGDLLNPAYGALNQLTNSNSFPTLENQSEQFLPNDFHETYLQVVYPILNTDIRYNYKAKKELISVQEAKKRAYEDELQKEIKVAYYQYLQVLSVMNIYDETEILLKEVLRVNQKLVDNDLATNEIIYGAEYEIAQLKQQVVEAQKNEQIAKAFFNFLLNKELTSEILADTTLLAQIIENDTLSNLQNQALDNRDEFTQIESGIAANNQAYLLNKASQYPKINVVGQAGFQGFTYSFDSDQDYMLLQFSLVWDLFKGKSNKYKLQQTQIEEDILKTQYAELEQQIQLQVQQAYYEVIAAEQAIITNQSSQISAYQNYNLTKKKYEQGQARYIELIDTQTKYTNAQLSLIVAQYDLLIKQANLERAIGL